MLRLRPDLAEAVAKSGVPLTQAIEQGLALWLDRQCPLAVVAPEPAVSPKLPHHHYRPPGRG
jgi:hypothetical protein